MGRTGRPSKYNRELADKICGLIATSTMSLTDIGKKVGIDQTTIAAWIRDKKKVDPEDKEEQDFSLLYVRAKEAQMHMMAEEILDIADNATNDYMLRNDREGDSPGFRENGEVINRSRLRIESRKWLMAKLAPKVYGDKVTQEHTGPSGGPIQTQAITFKGKGADE